MTPREAPQRCRRPAVERPPRPRRATRKLSPRPRPRPRAPPRRPPRPRARHPRARAAMVCSIPTRSAIPTRPPHMARTHAASTTARCSTSSAILCGTCVRGGGSAARMRAERRRDRRRPAVHHDPGVRAGLDLHRRRHRLQQRLGLLRGLVRHRVGPGHLPQPARVHELVAVSHAAGAEPRARPSRHLQTSVVAVRLGTHIAG